MRIHAILSCRRRVFPVGVGAVDRLAGDPPPVGDAAPVREAGARSAADAAAHAATAGTVGRSTEQRQRLNEETIVLQGNSGEPAVRLPAADSAVPRSSSRSSAFVLRAIAGWKSGTPTSYGLTVPVVTSALHAKIFGVPLAEVPPARQYAMAPEDHHLRLRPAISAATTYLTMRQSQKARHHAAGAGPTRTTLWRNRRR